MKKLLAWITLTVFALSLTGAVAESNDAMMDTLSAMEWSFYSGVGAWSTDFRILPDGSFSGEYHDSEMGEAEEDYPEGTVYFRAFTGRLSLTGERDEYSWTLRIDELLPEETEEQEWIDGGIRFVLSETYGLSQGDEMVLYAPGTPVGVLPEEMIFWTHVMDRENPPAELENWFLMSEANASGFVGEQVPETPLT